MKRIQNDKEVTASEQNEQMEKAIGMGIDGHMKGVVKPLFTSDQEECLMENIKDDLARALPDAMEMLGLGSSMEDLGPNDRLSVVTLVGIMKSELGDNWKQYQSKRLIEEIAGAFDSWKSEVIHELTTAIYAAHD